MQILALSKIAGVAFYGEDDVSLSHSQEQLYSSCYFQAFIGGYIPIVHLLGSQRWLPPRLDLVSSLPILLDVNQIQGFMIRDLGEFWVLTFGDSAILVFQRPYSAKPKLNLII
jgi:hypothetical protein